MAADTLTGAGLRYPFPDPPAEGAAVEVAPGVLWMRLPLPMKLDHVNVFALRNDRSDGGGWTVVDTGFRSRRGIALWQALLAGPLAGAPVTRVIVTHHHPDHVGMASWLMENGNSATPGSARERADGTRDAASDGASDRASDRAADRAVDRAGAGANEGDVDGLGGRARNGAADGGGAWRRDPDHDGARGGADAPKSVGLDGHATGTADLWMPRTGWLMARMLTLDVQERYPAETVDFYRRSGMDAAVLAQRLTERPFNFADCVGLLPLGHTRLTEGARVRFGARSWTVRMGDGHAPEHATFWSEDCALVIGGDQLLPSISPNLGVYPTEPEADPVGDWLDACERLAPHARDDHLVLPGHKLPFTGLPFRMRQFTDNHHGALARLMEYLATPRRGGDCFAPLYRREIGAAEYGLALVEAVAHLNHLHRNGRVRRWMGSDGAWRWQAKDG